MSVKILSMGLSRGIHNNKTKEIFQDFVNKKLTEAELVQKGKEIALESWKIQKNLGIDKIVSNDFTFFDHVLDTTCMVGNISRRYYWEGGPVSKEIYAMMIYGTQREKFDVLPSVYSKYFNQNYLYCVPEFSDPVEFIYSDNKPILDFLHAKQNKIDTVPFIMGPMTYLMLGRTMEEDIDVFECIDELIGVYENLCVNLKRISVEEVIFYEPYFSCELSTTQRKHYKKIYTAIREKLVDVKLIFANFYGRVTHNINLLNELPVDMVHLDLSSITDDDLNVYLNSLDFNRSYSLGVINGNNTWKANLSKSTDIVKKFQNKIAKDKEIYISTSCPMFNLPFDVELEDQMPKEIKSNLSFCLQKQKELITLRDAINKEEAHKLEEFSTHASPKFLNALQNEAEKFSLLPEISERAEFVERKKEFLSRVNNEILPIIHNGYTPLESELANTLRKIANEKEGLSEKDKEIIKQKIRRVLDNQNASKVDVLSYGEVDRVSDIDLFVRATDNTYLLRKNPVPKTGDWYVYPGIVYDMPTMKNGLIDTDLVRHALSLEEKKTIKFTLPGPFSLMNQFYLPENIDKMQFASYLAGLIFEEIKILQSCGVKCIGINESCFTSHLSAEKSKASDILQKTLAVHAKLLNAFSDDTQACLYMGYFDILEIFEDLDRLDYDLLMIESCRSQDWILQALIGYKNFTDIAFGVMDPLSSRRVVKNDILRKLKHYIRLIDVDSVWIALDCGVRNMLQKNIDKDLATIVAAIKDVKIYLAKDEEI